MIIAVSVALLVGLIIGMFLGLGFLRKVERRWAAHVEDAIHGKRLKLSDHEKVVFGNVAGKKAVDEFFKKLES